MNRVQSINCNCKSVHKAYTVSFINSLFIISCSVTAEWGKRSGTVQLFDSRRTSSCYINIVAIVRDYYWTANDPSLKVNDII